MIWFETATRIDGGSATGRLIVLVSRLHQIIYGLGGLILAISILILILSMKGKRGTKVENFQKPSSPFALIAKNVQPSISSKKEKLMTRQISHKIEKQLVNDPPPTYNSVLKELSIQ